MSIEIYKLKWEEHDAEHIWKHHVYMWEVEDVVFDDPGREARIESSKKHGTRIMMKGRTRTGRPLIVFLKPVDSSEGIWRCTTAWEER